jgi:hypothetical protein
MTTEGPVRYPRYNQGSENEIWRHNMAKSAYDVRMVDMADGVWESQDAQALQRQEGIRFLLNLDIRKDGTKQNFIHTVACERINLMKPTADWHKAGAGSVKALEAYAEKHGHSTLRCLKCNPAD